MNTTLLLLFFAFNNDPGCRLVPEVWSPEQNILALVGCVLAADGNLCPTAVVPSPQLVFEDSTVTLDGSNSILENGLGEATYLWTQVDNGADPVSLVNANSAVAEFMPPGPGEYEFCLTVTQSCLSNSAVAEVTAVIGGSQIDMDVDLVVSGMSSPVQVTHAGDQRLFVVLQGGVIRVIDNGQLLAQPFLDISSWVSGGFEQGLLGLAFDPDFAQNGFFYICYTGLTPAGSGLSRDSRLVAFQVSSQNPNVADMESATLLMSVGQPENNHNGGQIVFGPDGYLYVGFGDGGGAGDQHGTIGNGQEPATLLGKMLRIDVDGPAPYQVPPDNPFVMARGDGFLPEIWAYGLRNPWRFSFDRLTGDLFMADVGQNAWEEINYQSSQSTGGENYGWRLKEGEVCFNPSSGCDPGGLTDPIHVYSHSFGRCSVTGGFVYRGSDIPAVAGYYFFADWCTGEVFALDDPTGNYLVRDITLFRDGNEVSGNITAFGEDMNGELYVFAGSSLYKFIAVIPGN